MSAPFIGETFTFTDAQEREVTLRGWGNQHHAVFEDLNGYTVSSTRTPAVITTPP